MAPQALSQAQLRNALRQYVRAARRRALVLLGLFAGGLAVTIIGVRLASPSAKATVGVAGLAALANLAIYIARTAGRFHNEHAVHCPSCGRAFEVFSHDELFLALTRRWHHPHCAACGQPIVTGSLTTG